MTSTQLQTVKLFNSIATAGVIAISSYFAPAAVEARTSYCYETTKGADVCILTVQKHKTNPYARLVKSSVDGYVSYNTVTCNSAHNRNYKRNLAGIACFEFSF